MKILLFVGIAVAGALAGCANQEKIKPINPAVPYSANDRLGGGNVGSPPFQQGSVPTR